MKTMALAVTMTGMLLIICGCAVTVPAQKVTLTSDFDEAGAKRLMADGDNTISGSALIRQQGGGVVTCAGNEVFLIPVTKFSTERMLAIYGSDQKGYRNSGAIEFNQTPAEYLDHMRTVLGDAQGYFEFDKVANGEFYVSTNVSWVVGYNRQGGVLMQRVTVNDGETKKIVLSP
jgi:hypothetical protein